MGDPRLPGEEPERPRVPKRGFRQILCKPHSGRRGPSRGGRGRSPESCGSAGQGDSIASGGGKRSARRAVAEVIALLVPALPEGPAAKAFTGNSPQTAHRGPGYRVPLTDGPQGTAFPAARTQPGAWSVCCANGNTLAIVSGGHMAAGGYMAGVPPQFLSPRPCRVRPASQLPLCGRPT